MTVTFTDDPIRAAADAVLSGMGIKVYLGSITDNDGNPQTVSTVYPYLLRGLVMPFDTNLRVGGRGSAVHQFTLQTVHTSSEGCMNVGNGVRDYLDGHLVIAAGREFRLRRDVSGESPVLRDETWTRPGGGALFYTSDRYSIL